MAQIHCYIPDTIAEEFRIKAEQAHLSVSKYLAQLVKQEVGGEWPEGYFENLGQWEGEPLTRPKQQDYEQRATFD
jgi:hypothetical protein